MHQLVKLTDVIWLLQLALSSPLIHALGDPSQAPTGIWTQVPRLRGGRLTNWFDRVATMLVCVDLVTVKKVYQD